ncbi:arrestin domain-containing protein 17-like [Patiria miniata]|uniref:Arrestin C-terminal-like domain-containing protein n=1 Tax=Patiria miniata TaxID=46514 RepID=A0A914BMP0_PATMI|nr:arrestin domain-containing protein 17-like [Patiria miniata]
MGRLPLPVIVFDKKGLFSQRDFVSGEVKLEVDTEGLHGIKGVWMVITCEARNAFSTHMFVHHVQNEVYFDSTLIVFGAGKDTKAKADLSLPPGIHSFPFKYRLPTDKVLPSVFLGAYGNVLYSAKATLWCERGISGLARHTERMFGVQGPTVNLNNLLELNLKVPITRSTEVRKLLGLGATTGTVHFGLAKRGFVPREKITVTGCVDNVSGEEHRIIKVALVMETTYTVAGISVEGRAEHKKTLSQTDRSISCPRGKVTKFRMYPLRLPTGCPSSGLPGCEMIDVQYYVKCNTSGCIETSFRLTVGTVPIRSVSGPVFPVLTTAGATACVQPSVATPMDKTKMAAPTLECQARPSSFTHGPVSRVEDAPPSYEEAVASGTTNDI